MTHITYSLNAFELQFLVMLAERRNCGKQPNNVVNQKVDNKLSDFAINLIGAMGEHAVGKLLKVRVDTSVALSGDDKVSDLTYKGRTIQVKTRSNGYKNCTLHFRKLEHFKADVAVLAVVKSVADVEVIGWTTKEAFRTRATIHNFGYNDVYGMPESDLQDPQYLEQYLETL